MEKQKRKLPDSLIVTAGLLLLLICGILTLIARGGEFSVGERRYLADRPDTPNLQAWDTDKTVERFMTDHIPGRQTVVAAESLLQVLSGRRTQLGAWYTCGAIVEPPVEADPSAVEGKLRRFGKLADAAGTDWVIVTPRTHGWLLRSRMEPLMAGAYGTESENYTALEADPHYVRMPDAFNENPDTMYYRTDHHWTLAGAWQAYAALGDKIGYDPLPLENFQKSSYPGFRGTTLSRSALPDGWWSDVLDCAEPDAPVTVTMIDRDGTTTADRQIMPEKTRGWDGYAVYLGGNHGTMVIENPDAPTGTIIVFKDSMANCLLPLLSAHFRRIIAVDARYDSGVFSDALERSDDTKAILFVYSLDSLVNDTEITRKAK